MKVEIGNAKLYLGDCLEILRTLPDSSVDSVVTDPPYGLSREPDMAEVLRHWLAGDDYVHRGSGFMGKAWDSFVPGPAVWRECLRVLKPGGHLLAFFGTRTQDMGTLAIRLAGFEIRDSIAWVYGSGFPKSLDVSKAIDKAAGAGREVLSERRTGWAGTLGGKGALSGLGAADDVRRVTAPATDAARQWEGWGTALKPALEPITVARKPLIGTVAANVLAHGTGALNIDGCRVGTESTRRDTGAAAIWGRTGRVVGGNDAGRWPANLIHDGSDEVVALFPEQKSPAPYARSTDDPTEYSGLTGTIRKKGEIVPGFGDSGSAARFFYCAKASRSDRDEGCDDLPKIAKGSLNMKSDAHAEANGNLPAARGNHHPTVKPTDLMRWLCRLVTPAGGLVLDPFTGSGSTGRGALAEGFEFIGVEQDPAYFDIACRRIEDAQRQGRLIA